MQGRDADRITPLRDLVRDPYAGLSNSEAEQALLGAILLNNRAYEHVADTLSDSDFASAVHGRIFTAVGALLQRGAPANPVTLLAHFAGDDTLKRAGGAAYLARLVESAVTVVNAPHYAHTIVDLARRRDVVDAAQDLLLSAADLADASLTAADVIAAMEERLCAIAERSVAGNVESLAPIADRALAETESAYRDGGLRLVATGLSDLDAIVTGWSPGNLVVCGARPGMGKTALAGTVAYNLARLPPTEALRLPRGIHPGKVSLFFSLEMSKAELVQRWLAGLTGIATEHQRHGRLDAVGWQKLVEARGELARLPIFIDDQARLSVAQMRQRARRLKRRLGGLDLVIVDHLQLVRQGGRPENRRLEIDDITSALKAMAKELGCPVLALSQLSRTVEQRDDKRPMLSDLRESGSIEQDSDIVLFLYREEYYLARERPKRIFGETRDATAARAADREAVLAEVRGLAEIIVAKQRHGRTGVAHVAWNGERQRFMDLAR